MNKQYDIPLVLLHGALGSKQQFDDILPDLEEHFEVYRLDFEGHGEAGPTDSPFRINFFAENVLGFLEEHSIKKANFFGYSMGGYVALSLANENPTSVRKVATLGTILRWNKEIAERECGYLNPSKMKEKVPHFVERLNDRHLAGWERVVDWTREMLHNLGQQPVLQEKDWKSLQQPIRLHVGDRDTTVGLEESIEIYKKIDDAELCVLPGTGHPIGDVNRKLLSASLVNFFLK